MDRLIAAAFLRSKRARKIRQINRLAWFEKARASLWLSRIGWGQDILHAVPAG